MAQKKFAITLGSQSHSPDVVRDENLAQKFQELKSRRPGLEDFLRDFLLQFISDETKRAYQADLEFFFQFVRRGGDLLKNPMDIKAYHFQLYRDELIKNDKAAATINRRLVAIRSFMKWSLAQKLIDHNPLDAVRLPKTQTETPTLAFDDDEVIQMINAPDITIAKESTHRLMMVLLFHLGLRRSELISIKLSDFYHDRGHYILKIHGKGDKIRPLPINDQVGHEIKNYLERSENFGLKLEDEDYLLQLNAPRKNPGPIDGSTVYRMVDRYNKKCGINKRVSPHSCRATAISHLLDTQRTPIRDVAIFAGHAQVTTTERYDKRRDNLDQSAAYAVDFIPIKKQA